MLLYYNYNYIYIYILYILIYFNIRLEKKRVSLENFVNNRKTDLKKIKNTFDL